MAFEVEWTDPALADLRDALAYLSQTSEEAAQRLSEKVFAHVELLANFPRIGPPFRRDRRRRVREILCGKHRIFYRVLEDEERVQILAVWHGSRRDPDLSQLLDRTE